MGDNILENDSKLLSRIDERTIDILRRVESIERAQREEYVTHEEFQPVKLIVYGMVSVILLSVLGAIITLIVNKST